MFLVFTILQIVHSHLNDQVMKYMSTDTLRVLGTLPEKQFFTAQQIADSLDLGVLNVGQILTRLRNHGMSKDNGIGGWKITNKGVQRYNAEFDKLSDLFYDEE